MKEYEDLAFALAKKSYLKRKENGRHRRRVDEETAGASGSSSGRGGRSSGSVEVKLPAENTKEKEEGIKEAGGNGDSTAAGASTGAAARTPAGARARAAATGAATGATTAGEERLRLWRADISRRRTQSRLFDMPHYERQFTRLLQGSWELAHLARHPEAFQVPFSGADMDSDSAASAAGEEVGRNSCCPEQANAKERVERPEKQAQQQKQGGGVGGGLQQWFTSITSVGAGDTPLDNDCDPCETGTKAVHDNASMSTSQDATRRFTVGGKEYNKRGLFHLFTSRAEVDAEFASSLAFQRDYWQQVRSAGGFSSHDPLPPGRLLNRDENGHILVQQASLEDSLISDAIAALRLKDGSAGREVGTAASAAASAAVSASRSRQGMLADTQTTLAATNSRTAEQREPQHKFSSSSGGSQFVNSDIDTTKSPHRLHSHGGSSDDGDDDDDLAADGMGFEAKFPPIPEHVFDGRHIMLNIGMKIIYCVLYYWYSLCYFILMPIFCHLRWFAPRSWLAYCQCTG
jgi:hypothetical protein